MVNLTINIIAFDIPYPANYGGTIDMFYKLRTLHQKNVGVILHCFEYNKAKQKELEKYCKEIYYYPRMYGIRSVFSKLPYIVVTRNNKELIRRLKDNNYPILFEGLHTCFYLGDKDLKDRKKLVRTHNVEHDYYKGLQKASTNILKKVYFALEARKLKKYESVLAHADVILSISKADKSYFSHKYNKVHFIPAFHPFDEIIAKAGKGDYFLYHGNLSVEENIVALHFLLNKVFNTISTKLVIAGKNPDNNLVKLIEKRANVKLHADPTHEQMNELLVNAQGCILPTFQSTGLKLKLLISLFSSRFVIANSLMIKNTALENLCELADTADEFILSINKLTNMEFNQQMLSERIEKLRSFTNDINGDKLVKIITDI